MAKLMTKSELIEKMAAAHSELSKKDVKGVMETLATVGCKELKNNGAYPPPPCLHNHQSTKSSHLHHA